ncbi:MAG TPA: lipoyl synthase [Firmicutes bacterium]|nr:lipoyl synthase [Bacillota bacterium]
MEQRKPAWLKIRLQSGEGKVKVEALLKRLSLHTVCEEAKCPNLMECFNRRTATFMILGRFCTRNCTFCKVEKGIPSKVDQAEPAHIAEAVKQLQLQHVVITSVTRDDLSDGGASQFDAVIKAIRDNTLDVVIEVLIPDFQGDWKALKTVIAAQPKVINHNLETVPRLYPMVRPLAEYRRSLELLRNVKRIDPDMITKSGIMVGLGERQNEVLATLRDLRSVHCDILTIGQYLAPSREHHPVSEYIHPNIFERYRKIGIELGFRYITSGPLIRSSYHADEALDDGKFKSES